MPCSTTVDLFRLDESFFLSLIQYTLSLQWKPSYTPKDSIHAGFFDPFKMDAKMNSVVCWFFRQYPFYA